MSIQKWLGLGLSICILSSGCARLGHQFSIGAFDGETTQPIQGATVEANYIDRMVYVGWLDFFPPKDSKGTSGADGVAHLNVSRTSRVWDMLAAADSNPTLTILAPGYLAYSKSPKEFSYLPESFEARQINGKTVYVIPLYRQPAPEIVIVLPDGYRGPVRVTRMLTNRWLQDAPGKRSFEFEASAEGDVEIQTTPLLHRIEDSPYYEWRLPSRDDLQGRIRFRYRSGQEIPRTSAHQFQSAAVRPGSTFPTSQLSPRSVAQREFMQKLETQDVARGRASSRPAAQRPREFGVDLIASEPQRLGEEPARKRSLYVVGGEQEMVRMLEAVGEGIMSGSNERFEAAWNLR